MQKEFLKAAKEANVLPSLLVTQKMLESNWGKSDVAKADNNWGGMSWFDSDDGPKESPRVKGITIRKGSKRLEDNYHYVKYESVSDYLVDWVALIKQTYKVSGKSTLEEATKGLFEVGGAGGDYAAYDDARYGPVAKNSQERFEFYYKSLKSIADAINEQNDNWLEKQDEAFRKNELKVESSSESSSDSEKTAETTDPGVCNFGSYWEPDEDAIPNMPSFREYEAQAANGLTSWEDYTALYLDPEQVEEDFKVGSEAAASIAKWKEEVSERKTASTVSVARRTLMLTGVFMAIFGAIVNILYVIDRLNPLGFSIISIMTKGKVSSIGSTEYLTDVKKKTTIRMLTDKNIFIWVAIFGFASSFLISGLAYEYLGMFTNFIIEFFTKLGGLFQ